MKNFRNLVVTRMVANIESYVDGINEFLESLETFSEEFAKTNAKETLGRISCIQELIEGIQELEDIFNNRLDELYNHALSIYGYEDLEDYLFDRLQALIDEDKKR